FVSVRWFRISIIINSACSQTKVQPALALRRRGCQYVIKGLTNSPSAPFREDGPNPIFGIRFVGLRSPELRMGRQELQPFVGFGHCCGSLCDCREIADSPSIAASRRRRHSSRLAESALAGASTWWSAHAPGRFSGVLAAHPLVPLCRHSDGNPRDSYGERNRSPTSERGAFGTAKR